MASLVAQFNSSVRTGVAPLTVNFTNTSTGPYTSVRWDFGDGTQSTQVNPSHQFVNDGVFQVTLTIFDEISGQSQSQTTITVFADLDYSTSSTTQQALFTSKRFSTGQVSVRKVVTDGSAVETEWPIDSAGNFNTTGNLVIPFSGYAVGTTVPNQITIANSTYLTQMSAVVDAGYECWMAYFAHTGNTPSDVEFSGSPMYMYKVTGRTASSFYVDRWLPYFSGTSTVRSYGGFLFAHTGTTGSTLYTDTAFKSTIAASALDSLETLDYPDLYQPNTRGNGLLKYFEDDNQSGNTRLYIMPSFSGWNTVESWKAGSVRLWLPYIMWHTSPDAGVHLIDSTTTYRDDATNLTYTNLTIEGGTEIVGRAFLEKKIISIDDVELQAALQFTSNRNFTMPEPVVSTTRIADAQGGLRTGITYWITYRMRDPAGTPLPTSAYFGNGDIQPLHCRYLQEVTPLVDGTQFRIQAPLSTFYRTTKNSAQTGFTSTIVDVLIGSATTGNFVDANWIYSGNVCTPTVLSTGINVSLDDGAWTDLTFTDLKMSGNTYLAYGDDPFVIGYFSALSQSTIYKMSATCVAKNNEFNTTQNQTFDESLNESVYITEVALYNENNELLMTGKLNNPIEKNDEKFVTIKLELDL